jgi:DNA invertase Pin-like site-specific DNA recombinase
VVSAVSSRSGVTAATISTASTRRSAAYLRVSTEDQNLGLQTGLIKAQKPDLTYSDKESGTLVERRAYTELCKEILLGRISEVIVYRLDRLGRDPVELIRFFDELERRHVEFRSLTEPWLSNWDKGPMQFLTWWLQIGMAKFELLLLKDRQRRGIDAAKAKGKHLGRPRKK